MKQDLRTLIFFQAYAVAAIILFFMPSRVSAETCLEAAKAKFPLISTASCVPVADADKECYTPGGQSITTDACAAGTLCCGFYTPADVLTGHSGATSTGPAAKTFCFPDPLTGACGVEGGGVQVPILVQRIISAVLSLVGALFFVMFLWGGTRYLTAGGDAESVKKARKILSNAVIGMLIIALSYAIVATIATALDAGWRGR